MKKNFFIYPFFLILLLFPALSLHSQESDIDKYQFNKKDYYFCDYKMKNTYPILSSGNEEDCLELWAVSLDYIVGQDQSQSIVNSMDYDQIIKKAIRHAALSYDLKNLRFDKISIIRSSGFFYIYVYLKKDNGYTHIVPVLMDGRIVLSNKEMEKAPFVHWVTGKH